MLPTTPEGQSGSLAGPRNSEETGVPSRSNALRAQVLPAVNSMRRLSTAPPRAFSSSGESEPLKPSSCCTETTPNGKRFEIVIAAISLPYLLLKVKRSPSALAQHLEGSWLQTYHGNSAMPFPIKTCIVCSEE